MPKPIAPTPVDEQARLLERVRGVLARQALEVVERRMFGGVTMMLRDHMLCCVARSGLMLGVGAAAEGDALARPGARPCLGTGRRMTGFIMIDHDAVSNAAQVRSWLRVALDHVAHLPPRSRDAPRRKKRT